MGQNPQGSHDVKEHDSDTSRAEAFSDAVLAIVITLLTVELKPPEAPPGQLLSGLLHQWPSYVAYLASYAYIAVIWLNHKHTFMHVRAMNRGLHWANLGVLFTTALLPFATGVVSKALEKDDPADARTAVVLYAAVGSLLAASWLVLFRYLRHHPRLLTPDTGANFFHREQLRPLLGVVLYAIGGLIGALVSPVIALVIFLALPLFYGLTSHGLYEVTAAVRRRRGTAA